jgi:hypothetical protein
MTQDEIIEMAEQANLDREPPDGYCRVEYWTATFEDLEAYTKLVIAKEREDIIQIIKETPFSNWFQADVIEAIRARGEQA